MGEFNLQAKPVAQFLVNDTSKLRRYPPLMLKREPRDSILIFFIFTPSQPTSNRFLDAAISSPAGATPYPLNIHATVICGAKMLQ